MINVEIRIKKSHPMPVTIGNNLWVRQQQHQGFMAEAGTREPTGFLLLRGNSRASLSNTYIMQVFTL